MSEELDIVIKNATIIDGSGKPAYKGSIGIYGEIIAELGEINRNSIRTIDANGYLAIPGFIDAHSHADLSLPWYPKAESLVMQGVTTFVGGQCGLSLAPISDSVRVELSLLEDFVSEVYPYLYYHDPLFPVEIVNRWMEEKVGWTIKWKTMGDLFNFLEKKGISCNYAPLVGHGPIRYIVLGNDYKRKASEQEVSEMCSLIEQAMEDGCIGMSTGLDYDPDCYADGNEIVRCVSALRKYNGIYAPHWRRTGRRRGIPIGGLSQDKKEGIKECIEIGRETGVHIHLAHISDVWVTSPRPAHPIVEEAIGKATLDILDRSKQAGVKLTFDVMPYAPSPPFNADSYISPMPYLCSLLAPWLRILGSRDKLSKWLKSKEFREEIKSAISSGKWFINSSYNPNVNPHWADNIAILESKLSEYKGKTLADIAGEQEKDPIDTYFDIIADDPDTRGAVQALHISGKWMKEFYKHPSAMIGLDTWVFDDKREMKSPPYSIPGVNTYSGFPSFIINNVKEKKLFTMEEAVRKTATITANTYGLKDRGIIKLGAIADIVLINYSKLEVMGDALEPRRYPKGIEYVLVNGTVVVEKGRHIGATPGKVLKRK